MVLEEDGEPLATAVLDPSRGELFSAARGEGAHRDGVALRVRDGAPLREAVLSSFLRADKLRGTPPAASFGRLAEAAAVLRMGGAGSLELAWVAAGHIDAWAQPNVDAWDWLPGRLLVQEAGGRTAVIDGDPLTWFVAGAPGTFEELVALVSADALAALRGAYCIIEGREPSGGRGAPAPLALPRVERRSCPVLTGRRPTFDSPLALPRVERRALPCPSSEASSNAGEAPQAAHRLAPWTSS